MKVSVYAVNADDRWRLYISICPEVDRLWWSGIGVRGWTSASVDRMVMLSGSFPLGWAVKLREQIRCHPAMEKWTAREWRASMKAVLKTEIREEERISGKPAEDWFGEAGEMQRFPGSQNCDRSTGSGPGTGGSAGSHVLAYMKELSGAADLLVSLLSGRSLLQNELAALLAEQAADGGQQWMAAVQLAYLQGRLRLEAAVASGGGGGVVEGGNVGGEGKNVGSKGRNGGG
ncbi:hypothetical protein BK144_13220, partial [Paenibacillus sp. FSL R7-0273]